MMMQNIVPNVAILSLIKMERKLMQMNMTTILNLKANEEEDEGIRTSKIKN